MVAIGWDVKGWSSECAVRGDGVSGETGVEVAAVMADKDKEAKTGRGGSDVGEKVEEEANVVDEEDRVVEGETGLERWKMGCEGGVL
jgi:hypothetical protein